MLDAVLSAMNNKNSCIHGTYVFHSPGLMMPPEVELEMPGRSLLLEQGPRPDTGKSSPSPSGFTSA